MPEQLALFDLATAPAAPGAPQRRPAPKDTAPAPRAAQAPRRDSQAAPASVAPTRAEKDAAALADLEAERARYRERIAAAPAPAPPAELISALAALGVDYLGSYYWPSGGRIVGDEWEPSEELVAHHAVEGRFRPARGRMLLDKTDAGLVALRDALDLPDDLLAAGMYREQPPITHYITLPSHEEGNVGVSFAFGSLELNIQAAREYLAARATVAAGEAERAAKLTKKTKKARAS